MSVNMERLTGLLGYDPAKKVPSTSVFSEAVKEYNEERDKELKAMVKEKFAKAVELYRLMNAKKSELEGLLKKTEKELGKFVNQLEAMSKGNEPPKEEEKSNEEAKDSSN